MTRASCALSELNLVEYASTRFLISPNVIELSKSFTAKKTTAKDAKTQR